MSGMGGKREEEQGWPKRERSRYWAGGKGKLKAGGGRRPLPKATPQPEYTISAGSNEVGPRGELHWSPFFSASEGAMGDGVLQRVVSPPLVVITVFLSFFSSFHWGIVLAFRFIGSQGVSPVDSWNGGMGCRRLTLAGPM